MRPGIALERAESHQEASETSDREALWLAYTQAKAVLRAVSMYRSGVRTREQLLDDLREYSEFIRYAVDEMGAPALRPADGVKDQLDWLFRRRVIQGALSQCIHAHGPITSNWTGSAAKRIRGLILRRLRDYRIVAHLPRRRRRHIRRSLRRQ